MLNQDPAQHDDLAGCAVWLRDIGPLSALANAIYDACGVRMMKASFTPERVLNALMAKK